MMSTKNQRRLNDTDLSTIRNGLYIAATQFDKDAALFREAAVGLRAGEVQPLWAKGEVGARAAERTAEQFDQQAADSRRLAEELCESAFHVILDFTEEV